MVARNADVLAVTAFSALLVWVLFAAILYLTERDNPDSEMQQNYKTVPHSMWITLLNLSGESPLCQYSALGKVVTGFLGLFATAIFGIPIGVMGAGFEGTLRYCSLTPGAKPSYHDTLCKTLMCDYRPFHA